VKASTLGILLFTLLCGRAWGILQVDFPATTVPTDCLDDMAATLYLVDNPAAYPATGIEGPDSFPTLLHLLFNYDNELTSAAVLRVELRAGAETHAWTPAPFTVFYGQGPLFPVQGEFGQFPSCATAVGDAKATMAGLAELQILPNPANPGTVVRVEMQQAGGVRLRVVDLLGREHGRLFEGELSAGAHAFPWSGSAVSSGLYLAVLDHAGGRTVARILLLK